MVHNMKIHFFGTVSGLWQLPERCHQSMAFEVNNALYVFDAGACCSRTMQLMDNIDLLKIKKVIISHAHMDHIGGLGNLFWDINRQRVWLRRGSKYGEVELYMPDSHTWKSWQEILNCTEAGVGGIDIPLHPMAEGIVFEDENMKVTAYGNNHIPVSEDGKYRSFSFLIEAEGKKIIYTGDIKEYAELDRFAPKDGIDALIGETGHHDYMDVCDWAQKNKVKNLFYTHIGRSIMVDEPRALRNIKHNFDGNAYICKDSTTVEI